MITTAKNMPRLSPMARKTHVSGMAHSLAQASLYIKPRSPAKLDPSMADLAHQRNGVVTAKSLFLLRASFCRIELQPSNLHCRILRVDHFEPPRPLLTCPIRQNVNLQARFTTSRSPSGTKRGRHLSVNPLLSRYFNNNTHSFIQPRTN